MWPIAADAQNTNYDPYAALKGGKYDYKKTMLPALAGMVSGAALSAMKGNNPRQATINAMLGGIGGGAGAFGDELGRQTTYNKELAALINQNLWKQKEYDQKQSRYDTDALLKNKKIEKITQDMTNAGKPKSETSTRTTQDAMDKIRAKRLELKRQSNSAYMNPELQAEIDNEIKILEDKMARTRPIVGKNEGNLERPVGEDIPVPLPKRVQEAAFSYKGAGGRQSQNASQVVRQLMDDYNMDQGSATAWVQKNFKLVPQQ